MMLRMMSMRCGGGQRLLYLLWLGLLPGAASAEVSQVNPSGFVSTHQLTMAAKPSIVYRALTKQVHRWWDASHSYSGEAKNFSLQAKAGGCFCETLGKGGSVGHMRVVFAQPGKRLRLSGGLGPLQAMGVSGAMDFVLTPDGNGTLLQYRYQVTGGSESKLDALAGPVDAVQLGQLQRLQQYLRQYPKSVN